MSVYIRRFLFDPGTQVLLNIESVNILDLAPPSSIQGIGTGTVLLTAEFEDGPFNTPYQIAGATDLVNTFGGLGFAYNGVPSNYPCAVARNADGTLATETWNGNGFVALSGKTFASLVACRADTRTGNIQFTPCAFITGAAAFRYVLTAGQVMGLDVGAGPATATFTATAATVTSGAQTFATGFVGGEVLTLGYDGQPNFTVTFLSSDQTQAAVIARINSYAGFTLAASVTGTTMSITGRALGNQAQVRVVSGTGTVLTALGLAVATTFGTGNVANIAAVTAAEIIAVIQAAIVNTRVEVDQNGAIRISNSLGTASSFVLVTSATTATALGFTVGQVGTQLGVAAWIGSSGVFITTGGSGSVTMSVDGGVPFTFATVNSETAATVIGHINTAAGQTIAYADGTQIALIGKKPGGNITIISTTLNAALTGLGFSTGTRLGTAIPGGQIPAGTLVQTATGTGSVVTMQAINFTSAGVTVGGIVQTTLGPWTVPVRPAVDDGTGLSTGAGLLVYLPIPPLLFAVNAVNLQATSAALSEAAIDAAYVIALQSTVDVSSVAKLANISYCARQSNTVRRAMRQNALDASSKGLYGRFACIRPPLGIAPVVALSNIAEPGVGAYRDQRVAYCYPGARTFVPLIAQRGTSGGTGFTFDGNIDVGADGVLASILSQLPPEENPGQETTFTAYVIDLESSPNMNGWTMDNYIAFKAAGICALRMDDGNAIFQSGVTSVDPGVYPNLARISRRRMADFCQDSAARTAKAFGKKLSTQKRRDALKSELTIFSDDLLGVNGGTQRIGGYKVSDKDSNSDATLSAGMYRLVWNIKTLPSLDSIVIQTTIGEFVTDVTEVFPQAA